MEPRTMTHTDRPARSSSSGPVSRTVRLLLAAFSAWLAWEWATAGIDWFSRTSTRSSDGMWLVAGLAVYYGLYQFPHAAFGRAWARRTLIAAAVALTAAAAAAIVLEGHVWQPPFTWLLFGLELGFLIVLTIAHVVAVALGTRGCEMAGLAELVHRVRGTMRPRDEPMSCIVGLHHLDEWEAQRPVGR